MSHVELHFHILPAIDDGPATMEASLELAAAAAADGTGTIVATPHVRSDFVTDVSELPERVRELRERLDREGIAIRVLGGAELGHDMIGRLTQPELEVLAQGPPGCRWLLVEAPFAGLGADFTAATDELRDRGFGVVVAHPERSARWDSAGLAHELAAGGVLQLNAPSILRINGVEAEAAALALLRRAGTAAVLASDAHGPERPPVLRPAVDMAVASGLRRGAADRLVGAGPRRLLERGLRAMGQAAAA